MLVLRISRRSLSLAPRNAYFLQKSTKKSLEVTWYDVPYDFGLSAGKTFLTAQTTTEFVLILDDDFVRTPHTSARVEMLGRSLSKMK